MTKRKKKLRIIQFILIITSFVIIFYTYNNNSYKKEEIISKSLQEKIEKNLNNQSADGDVFFNIEYSGIDLNGNRYILKSKEARTE